MPPANRPEHDEIWLAELQALDADIEFWCHQADTHQAERMFFMGDINIQPDSLRGGPEPKRKRHRAWTRLMDKWSFFLHNPIFSGTGTQEVHLPLRQRNVRVQRETTRHGVGDGRAIDLFWGAKDVRAEMVLHNGLHCGGVTGCRWPDCVEFAFGDHFLFVASLTTEGEAWIEPAAPRFPMCWRDTEGWKRALKQSEGVLDTMCSVLSDFEEGMHASGSRAVEAEQCLGDMAAWHFSSIAHLVRDAWVQIPRWKLPREVGRMGKHLRTGLKQPTDKQGCAQLCCIDAWPG